MVGPDDAYKKDNHTNPEGFRYEGDAFFKWLEASGISNEQFFILCGDRHWQYHAKHPGGFEEFSCGALVDNNSRAGRIAGDSKSTDPDGKIEQFYIQGDAESASGGFLMVNVFRENNQPQAHFRFFDEHGKLLYEVKK
jgi:alkaline phosphatase/alkaline phosphatase D